LILLDCSMNSRFMNRSSILLYTLIFLLIILISPYFLSLISNDDRTTSGKASTMLRKSSLETDEMIRVDYLDDNDNVVYAADKQYATIIMIKDAYGHIVLEKYFDEFGEPTIQADGHYALRRFFNDLGQNYKTTYLDRNGNPTTNKMGYATIERFFYSDGEIRIEHFLNEQGERVQHRNNEYSRHYFYNTETGTTSIIYMGENDEPISLLYGYSKVVRTFWENGKIKTEFYYDVDNKPVRLSLGQYGVYKEYDKYDRNNLITYLDLDGKPITNLLGYTTVKKTYSSDNAVETEMYYDEDGNTIQLSHGQSGVKTIGKRQIYLDSQGREIFELSNFLFNFPWVSAVIGVSIVLLSSYVSRKMNIGILFIYLVFFIYLTLLQRNSNEAGVNFELLWSYKQFFTSDSLRIEILNNIWLFIPLGCLFYRIFTRTRCILLIISISISIELLQLFLEIGLCEIDDIISNVIGGTIGYWIGYIIHSIISDMRKKDSYTQMECKSA